MFGFQITEFSDYPITKWFLSFSYQCQGLRESETLRCLAWR